MPAIIQHSFQPCWIWGLDTWWNTFFHLTSSCWKLSKMSILVICRYPLSCDLGILHCIIPFWTLVNQFKMKGQDLRCLQILIFNTLFWHRNTVVTVNKINWKADKIREHCVIYATDSENNILKSRFEHKIGTYTSIGQEYPCHWAVKILYISL